MPQVTKLLNPIYLWARLCSVLRQHIKTANWDFILFQYEPDCYFLLEIDLTLSGTGSFSVKKSEDKTVYYCERSVFHFVIFRTKFGLRKKWVRTYENIESHR